MKLYVISGLGADFSVLKKIQFPKHLEIVFIDWLIPEQSESFSNYVYRMASAVDDSQPFCLLGYSFGGIIVQEINKIKKAQKIVILGSIKSYKEKSFLLNILSLTSIVNWLPTDVFKSESLFFKFFFRYLFGKTNENILKYFAVKDPYYLRWCVNNICHWKGKGNTDSIQILAANDVIFPVSKCAPDYIVEKATHLFPLTHPHKVTRILEEVFK